MVYPGTGKKWEGIGIGMAGEVFCGVAGVDGEGTDFDWCGGLGREER